MTRLADLCFDRPKTILVAAVLLVLTCGVVGGDIANRLGAAAFDAPPGSSSDRAARQASASLGHKPDADVVVLATRPSGLSGDQFTAELSRTKKTLAADKAVGRVTIVRPSGAQANSASLLVFFDRSYDFDQTVDAGKRLQQSVQPERIDLHFGGFGTASNAYMETARTDLLRAELLVLPILVVLLLLIFRSVIATTLPLAVVAVAALGSFAALRGIDDLTPIAIFALNVSTALGLGLAVDYSLLIVSRYREELERAGPGREALRTTMQTAGRAVMFSGLTVAACLAALIVFPQRLIYSLGYAGTIVCIFAMLAALLVLPALLSLLGDRVNRLSVRSASAPSTGRGGWYRLSQFVTARPLIVALATASALIALGLPAIDMRLTGSYPSELPSSQQARQVDDVLASGKTGIPRTSLFVVVTPDRGRTLTPGELASARSELLRLARQAGLQRVSAPPPQRIADDARLFRIDSSSAANDRRTDRLVDLLSRTEVSGAQVTVGGKAAEFHDFKGAVLDRIPLALALMGIVMVALVFWMTGSIVLALKTFIMNLLSLVAAFGVLTFVFQQGHLQGLLEFRSPDGVELTIVPFIFAAGFGLSTDYGVFLLARIKELHDQGLPDSEAIAQAMQTTGRVITGAAAVLVVALAAMVTSQIHFIKEAGLGLALVVAIDATLVRLLLVPSLMKLMGRWNWWTPTLRLGRDA